MKDLTTPALFSWAWEKFTRRPLLFIGIFFVAFIVGGVSSYVLSLVEDTAVTYPLFWVGDYVVQTLISMGIMAVGLKAYKDGKLSVRDLWYPKYFWRYLAGTILTGAAILIGFVLLIVPGFIAMAMFMFTPYIIVAKGLTPIAAMRHSMMLTEGNRLTLIIFLLAAILANVLGALLFGVGLLVTVPVTLLATVRAYHLLEANPRKEKIA